eukprot:GFUD01019631.1.p1 GENE.GFUD01019631.1~~GFUD01019631.1.p1  ORF type:complete len:158 (-),score=52.11 GFUD01019631.1:108-581(-)
MVRFKKRYFVVEFERAQHVNQSKEHFDLEPLNSKDIDIANAVKDKVQELHGDFGRASISVGFKVIYANTTTRLVIIRTRHGPHRLVASALPFVTKIRAEGVVGQLLYTGATIKHCQLFMVRRQTRQLEMAKKWLANKKMDQEKLKENIMDIRQIDPC